MNRMVLERLRKLQYQRVDKHCNISSNPFEMQIRHYEKL